MSAPAAHSSRLFFLLCAHCFCAIGALGIFLPYFALFLRENVGLSGAQIGLVLALPPLIGLFAQPAWGHVADRTGSRVRVLVVLAVGTAFGFVGMSHAVDLASTVLATVLLALFQTALIPMSVSVTFGALTNPSTYGRVRVWGTVGYLLLIVVSPSWLQAQRDALGLRVVPGGPSEPGLELLFYLAAALSVGAAITALGLRGPPSLSLRAQRGDLRALLALPAFVRVLVFSAGIQLFIQGPLVLFPLYVRARGGDMSDVSHMWIWMLLLEVPMIFGSGWLFERFGVTRVMIVAAVGGSMRWIACACAPSLALAYPVQLLHALVVTGLGVGTALHVEQIIPGRLRSTGQALVVMVGSSLGGMLSSVLCGAALDQFGVDAVYLVAGAGGTLWALAWWRPLVRAGLAPELHGRFAEPPAPTHRASREPGP
jgi:MFS transporter, PPP family, 3-phenylpropionic acid transporter